jgi:aspartate carbamoyltransferase catalytic subunit
MRHLLAVSELSRDEIEALLDLAGHFTEVTQRDIPKVPALRGRTVVLAFFEDSTRTRMSFDLAARRLSADVVTFAASASSLSKGESLRDTVETIAAMGVDAVVVRHRSSGVPWQLTRWCDAAIVNAGDGWHQHPTQALVDAFTIRQRRGPLDGMRLAICGDVAHSRVARSGIEAFTALGAHVVLVAPRTLLPPAVERWPVEVAHGLDDVVGELDVVYLLRIQHERLAEPLLPSDREYRARFGLTVERAARLKPDALIMHPGPMNRGVEIDPEVADDPRAVVLDQVANGVAVRMAVLFELLGPGRFDQSPPSGGGERR